MGERQISSNGVTRRLSTPFLVAATQNPIEHEGTYPLPEAQLDRFLFFVDVPMPDVEEERLILNLALAERGGQEVKPGASLGRQILAAAQAEVAAIYISPAVRDFVVRLVSATRGIGAAGIAAADIEHPSSPRGSIGLAYAAQARAWIEGRDHVVPSDIEHLAGDVLSGRIGLTYRARAQGRTGRETIMAILEKTPVI
jgi:MoxR-like ATPase